MRRFNLKRMLRVSVIGTGCSGKTTLARQIASKFHIPHVELDAVYWQPNWTPLHIDPFRSAVESAAAGDQWVIDGNYSKVRDIIWRRATDVVWLNPPFMIVLWRAIKRTGRRVITGEELFAGNRETMRNTLLDRDSILWWVIRTHHRRTRAYVQLLRRGSHREFAVHEIRKSSHTKAMLECLQMRANRSLERTHRQCKNKMK